MGPASVQERKEWDKDQEEQGGQGACAGCGCHTDPISRFTALFELSHPFLITAVH